VAYNTALHQWLSAGSTLSLSISKPGKGSGTVTSAPSGINCGTACIAPFAGGTSVTLTATPAAGSILTGWSGACSGSGTSCSFVMNGDTSVTANFSIVAITLGMALNNTILDWTTGGDAPFTAQTTISYSGGSAAQTGRIGNNQSTYLATSVTGPGTLSFYWKVSSEWGYDLFSVYLDGTARYSWSGNTAWYKSELTIPEGTHTVKWEYVKDSFSSSGQDAGWVDDVVFTPSPACTFSLSQGANGFAATSALGAVTVTPLSSSCSWTAASNASWITITSGSSSTGSGTVAYSVAANTTGSLRTGTMTVAGSIITVTQTGFNAALYFPHVDTSLPWQTEIAIINTSSDQTVTGTLRALSDEGQLVETKNVTLSARGRRQITIADEFTNHTDIGYIIFDTDSAAVQGYTKFYQEGVYRAAIPAVKEVNTSDIYISHIDSGAQWWTGVSLVNTTSATKELTITFNTGLSVPYTLKANEHKAFTIGSLFSQPLQPDIRSAMITNASGIIGLELFGSTIDGSQMDGILLTGNTTSTIYYPHVANDSWWTRMVAYNPSDSACSIIITPYSAQGTPLSPSTLSVAGKEKYIGLVAELGLPAQTAWFKIDSTSPITGFELFGAVDGKELAAYAEGSGPTKAGVFAKIEKNGWTGIAFVNTEADAASVTLTAYNDNGSAVATQILPVGGHAKVVNLLEAIFSQDIGSATYIAYSSDRNIVGFQLNGTSDGMMLDGLPGLVGTN
jgi:hypothetical protein